MIVRKPPCSWVMFVGNDTASVSAEAAAAASALLPLCVYYHSLGSERRGYNFGVSTSWASLLHAYSSSREVPEHACSPRCVTERADLHL